MNRRHHRSGLCALMIVVGLAGCQRDTPIEQARPTSAVDHAAQQAIDAVNVPMNKARSVEGTLEKAADRQAETVNNSGQ